MLKSFGHFMQQSWLLITASFIFGLLLAVTNAAWQPRIQRNEEEKFKSLASATLTEAVDFTIAAQDVEIRSAKGKIIKTNIKKATDAEGKCVGWAFICQGSGFADKIKIVLTVNASFDKLAGFGVLASNETPGFGDKIKNAPFQNQFAGTPVAEFYLSKIGDREKIDSEIIAITGATVSSEAVVEIMNNFIEQIKTNMQKEGLIE